MGRPLWRPPKVLFRPSDVGVAPDVLRRAVDRGAVVRICRGVYLAAPLVPDDPVESHLVRVAAAQMMRPDLVASHTSAALAHGLPLLDRAHAAAGGATFTIEPLPTRRSGGRSRVVLRSLPADAVTAVCRPLVGDLRITTAARTAIDLACDLPLAESLMIADVVARSSVTGIAAPRDLRGPLSERVRDVALRPLREASAAPIHTQRRVRRVIELTDPRRESPGESLSFGRIVAAGLPAPDCQRGFNLSGGMVFVDFWWDDFKLAGECDGKVKYDGTFGPDDGVLVREADRQHQLREAGVDVVRWRAADMMFRPSPVLDRMAARLRARGWCG
jgi:hypothetical protein